MAVEESSELASAVAAASSLKASAALVAEERAVAAEAVTAAAPMTTAGTTATTTASAILQKVQRDLNRLHDPASDRTTKRRALEALARETVGRADGVDDATAPLAAVNVNGMEDAAIVVREVFSGVHKELLRTMADPVEKCRELAVHVLGGFYARLDAADQLPFLAYLLPVLVDRTGQQSMGAMDSTTAAHYAHQQEAVEPSEEIRLQMVLLLATIVSRSQGESLAPCVEDMVTVVCRTLADPFPEVKKESCRVVRLLVEACPRQVGMQHTSLCKAIVANVLHKHANVRAATVTALGYLIKADASPLEDSTTIDVLKRVVHDKSGAVREALYATIASWLLEIRDREKCRAWIDDIGVMYERDNVDRLKDEMDFCPDSAGQGCRHLFRDNTMKIVSALMVDVNGWQVDACYRALQALETLFRFAEFNITGYAGQILHSLLKHVESDEAHVRAQTLRVTECLARYVEVPVFLDVLAPILESDNTMPAAKAYALKLLAAVVKGTMPADRLTVQFERLVGIISNRQLVESDHSDLQVQLLTVVENVVASIAQFKELKITDDLSYALFYTLLCLASNKLTMPEVDQRIAQCQIAFARFAHGLNSMDALYELHGGARLLPELIRTRTQWTRHAVHARVLRTFLLQAPGSLAKKPEFTRTIFDQLLYKLATAERMEDNKMQQDYDMRVLALDLLTELLARGSFLFATDDNGALPLEESRRILRNVVVANGVWRSGRRAEEVRRKCMELTAAMVVRGAAVDDKNPTGVIHVDAFREDILCVHAATSTDKPSSSATQVLVACFDEDAASTRQCALNVMRQLFSVPSLHSSWTEEQAKVIYQELLKRLDDSQDAVRILAANTFTAFLSPIGACMTTLDEVHHEAMIKGILIHVDDSNPDVQHAATDALRMGSSTVWPAPLFRDILTEARGKYRYVRVIDELLSGVAA